MWKSLWRSRDRFSLQEFKYQINELQKIKVVDKLNRESIFNILQSIVEIVTYGDRHDPSIFECFMEYQILAEFLRLLKIGRNSRIEANVLHYLSIMIQNMENYCFSNDYINNIILHPYEFDVGDLAPYYVSFLRTVSGKVNRDTICLLVKVQDDIVVSFPLYTAALKFARHEEKMIQIAVRALTFNIYNVSDDMVYAFITTPPVSEYFSDLVLDLRQQCFSLDILVNAIKDNFTHMMWKELLLETDKFIDDLYYCKDIIRVGDFRLSTLMIHDLLGLLIIPVLLPSLQSYHTNDLQISALSSLYIFSHLIQIFDVKEVVDSVAVALLYPYTVLSIGKDGGSISRENNINLFLEHLNEFGECLTSISTTESGMTERVNGECLSRHSAECTSSSSHASNLEQDDRQSKSGGILSLIFSENNTLLLASLIFLIILSESRELDDSLASMMGLSQRKIVMEQMILNSVLKFLVSQTACSALTQWTIGWVLRKLLVFQDNKLTVQDLDLFNMSYEKSCERLLNEVKGCWFDYIPVTLKNEWERCMAVLDESSKSKDPSLALTTALNRHIPDGDISSSLAWERMVETVKVFVLHHLIKAFVYEGRFPENPLLNLRNSLMNTPEETQGMDVRSVNFGSEPSLGSGIPCKISFSKGKESEVYLTPMAKGISGKLVLVEKIPHQTRRVVIAAAPLVGLNPTVDKKHLTWLHLRVRDHQPEIEGSKTGRYQCIISDDHVVDRRWTLGFSSKEACDAAQLLILKEISKQRSRVESLLAPLLRCSAESLLSNGGGDSNLACVV
ncbi:FPL domain-containing protein [Cinnamomum micranthum f. kanehirae]|uniref:FPL domain-containing protein n=1 Tax=Cinnamomum micranthum f. kanehirae TaxID=337451 RepID=A0A3S3MTV0_9MAGN|nr:FPL domain-containing protein [Cinnamomum micranthum f. kanehirae]